MSEECAMAGEILIGMVLLALIIIAVCVDLLLGHAMWRALRR